jgi:hypothetical protein
LRRISNSKKHSQYKAAMRVAGEDVEASAMQWHLDRHLKDGSVVLFVPVVEGDHCRCCGMDCGCRQRGVGSLLGLHVTQHENQNLSRS